MRWPNSARRILFLGCLACLAVTGFAAAEGWPQGYVVYQDTQSPDERYGILVPTSEAWDQNEASEEVNYLADLKNHRVMGKIKDADYFEHQNHRGLKAIWADDSRWCVVQYDDRFGFSSISIIEPKQSSFVQTDIGARIVKGLTTAIKTKGDPDTESGGDAVPYYRFDSGKVLVRVISTTDPKELDVKHSHFAFFGGTYDVNSKKWLTANARPLDIEGFHNGESAFDDEFDNDLESHSFSTAEDKNTWLDEQMNAIYNFVRVILPPARFAKIKEDQKTWLKKRDAAASVEAKGKLMLERIQELQEALW